MRRRNDQLAKTRRWKGIPGLAQDGNLILHGRYGDRTDGVIEDMGHGSKEAIWHHSGRILGVAGSAVFRRPDAIGAFGRAFGMVRAGLAARSQA